MIDKIKKYFTSISKVCVIEQITFESKTEYNYLEVVLVKDELKVLKQETFLNLESLKKVNSKKLPVLLNVNGHNVLTKINPSNIDAFENDHFLYSSTKTEGNTYFSIVRKDTINDIVNYINSNEFLLLDIFIGAHNILKYRDLFIQKEKQSLPHVFIEENEVFNYTFDKEDKFLYEKMKVGEEEVPTNYISPLAHALDYLLVSQFIKNETAFTVNRKESVFAKLIPRFSIIVVGVLFFTLASNHLFQLYLSQKYQDSELEATILENKKTQLLSLQKEVREKQKIFKQTGLNSNHGYSEFSDVIGSIIPEGIILNSLTISPILKKIKNNKKVISESNTILLAGEVGKIEVLNEFIIEIEKHNIFKEAKIVVFNKKKSHSEFELEFKI